MDQAKGGAMLQNESRLKLTSADVATAIAYYLTEVVFTRPVTVTVIDVERPQYNGVGDYAPSAFDVKFTVARLTAERDEATKQAESWRAERGRLAAVLAQLSYAAEEVDRHLCEGARVEPVLRPVEPNSVVPTASLAEAHLAMRVALAAGQYFTVSIRWQGRPGPAPERSEP